MDSFDWRDWLHCTDEEFAESDIAVRNLAVGKGLPGSENLNPKACIKRLNQWAGLIDGNAMNAMYQFERDPSAFWNSEAKFRILCMKTVLQRHLGVRYDESQKTLEPDFSDSGPQFLHGVLFGKGGTCISLPILYVAIGRRLGYPLYLVGAKEHFFVRWDDCRGERFDFDATNPGFEPRNDDYYHEWPRRLTERELASGYYLSNLTPRREMAAFMSARAYVCEDNFMSCEAVEAAYHARQMDPTDERLNWLHFATTVFHELLEAERGNGTRDDVINRWGSAIVAQKEADIARIRGIHDRKALRFSSALNTVCFTA